MTMALPVGLEFISQNRNETAVVDGKPLVPLQLAPVPDLPAPQFAAGATIKATGNLHVRVP